MADPALAALYRRLLAVRPQLPRVPVEVAFDADAGWLRVDRGTSVLLANFGDDAQRVPCPTARLELATHPDVTGPVRPDDPNLLLPARSGALLWKDDAP